MRDKKYVGRQLCTRETIPIPSSNREINCVARTTYLSVKQERERQRAYVAAGRMQPLLPWVWAACALALLHFQEGTANVDVTGIYPLQE